MDMTLQTQFQIRRQKKRDEIYAEYCKLAANPANSRSAIIEYLKNKFNIGASSTIYGIIKEKENKNGNN
jgi:hypothetical protein